MADNGVKDLTIIGGGPTGLFGLFYAGVRGIDTQLVEAMDELGGALSALYAEKFIYDMAGFPAVLAKDLVSVMHEQADQWKYPIHLSQKILDMDEEDDHFVLRSQTGEEFKSKTVLIANGNGAFAPRKMKLDGVEPLEGTQVFYTVKNMDTFRDKRVLVIGGGDSALDWALALEKICKAVTLIHRLPVWQAHEATVQELILSEVDVHFPRHEANKLHVEDGKLTGATIINLQSQETFDIEVDIILICIGFLMDISVVRRWGVELEGKRGIKVDPSTMVTSRPGIYAAGDIAAYEGKINLITCGASEAAMAVNQAVRYINPDARLAPGHSSDMDIFNKPDK
jgi:thioredoxin reductase (NADPH)